jgi:hypothetical protein
MRSTELRQAVKSVMLGDKLHKAHSQRNEIDFSKTSSPADVFLAVIHPAKHTPRLHT